MTRSHFSAVFFLLVFIGLKSFSQNPQQVGQWSPKIEFDIVPVALANLPDGKLVTWSSKYHHSFGGDDGFTYTQIFDPLGGSDGKGGVLPRTVTNTNHDMFCPGINNLADGRILVSGGSSSERTSIYNPRTGEWTRADDLNIPRGYQGAVTLSDGSAFTIGGSWSGSSTYGGRDGEHWTEATGWKLLNGLKGELLWNINDFNGEAEKEYRLDNHAWMWAAPNGKIFHAGPGEEMHWIDVSGNGSSTSAGKRSDDRESMNGNAVMFDIGKILKVGGSHSYSSDTPSSDKSYVIDINNGDVVSVNPTANKMAHSRIYVSSVVLPNGEVLVMGGMEKAVVFSDNGAHLSAEMYNPTTNRFRTLASMEVPRTYHSAGILLNDGRVLMGGGGLCGEHCAANHKDAEIFSPPYLFNSSGELATRPTLNAPDKASYGVQLPVAASSDVTEFAFLRMSSATHSVNNEQRRVPVSHTGSNGNFILNMPNANVMPPGYYMLFAINGAGVPSISKAVLVGKPDDKIQGDNLLVEFDFFEGSGALVKDISGKNNHGTIKERDNDGNAVPLSIGYWSADGLSGNSLQMNGIEHNSNTILEVPASPSLLALKNKITVMAWVNRDIGSVVTQNNNAIPNVAVFNYDYPRSFFMGYHGNQYKLEFWTKSGGTASIYHTGKRYTPGIWEHLVATYDGATARLYVNGEELQNVPVSGDLKINVDNNTIFNNFTLSGFYDNRIKTGPPPIIPSYSNNSRITDELDGRMDKFKLYDVALTAQEIQRIYNDEVKIVKNENPCDDVVLAYNINGKKDSGAQELSLRQGDDIELFVEGENADFVIESIVGPGNQILSSAVINNMQPNQSGTYRINYTIKETDLAQDLKVDGVSSFMDNRSTGGNFYYPGLRAVDGRTDTYWSTPWAAPGINNIPSHPHWITIDLGAESNVSGLDYLPRFNGGFLYGTIKDYEIYVFNSVSEMGSAVKTGSWIYDEKLKQVTFPEKKGRYVRLVALSEGDPKGGSTQASAAEIRIRTTKNTECFKDIVITAHAPRTFTYNEGWATNPGNPSGVSNKYDNIVINAGTEAIISENTSLDNLIIEEGAALTVDTNVILTFNSITLNSTSTSFPSLIDKGWIAGDVRYNRFVNKIGTFAGGGNDLVSSPVIGVKFDADFVVDNPKLAKHPTTNGVFAFAPFNVETGNYENFNIGTNYSGSFPLETGAGYRAATTDGSPLNFKGQITRNPLTIDLSSASQGNAWNLIGNPYPSYIDFEAFYTANAAEFDSRNAYQAIYGYTGNSNGWTVWNLATIAGAHESQLIAPGQGFFVKSKPDGGSVKFLPEMRVAGSSDDFVIGRGNRNVAFNKLKLVSATANEVTSIYFIEGTTRGMDSGYDANVFNGAAVDFSIFTNLIEDNTGMNMAIQSLPYEDFNDVVVPLGIKAKAGTELSISIEEGSTIPSNVNVYLEDTETNTFISMNENPYSFTSTNLNSANRFYVHYSSKTLSVEDMQSDDNLRIYTTVVPKALVIRGPLSSATTANLYDIQGRLVLSKVLNPHSSENTVDISQVSTGVYVVKVSTDNQFKTQKVIIK